LVKVRTLFPPNVACEGLDRAGRDAPVGLGSDLQCHRSALRTPHDSGNARPDTLTEVSRSRRGVGHPIWLVSLALLIVNDHVLKGAGLLPGWLTGKLSDFAGLIVAPVLIAAIAGARRAGARVAACALVAVGFVAIKLSPVAAGALERALALAHIHWRVWSDPTDLAALVVLPVAWWLTRRPAPTAPPARAPARATERLLVISGALACLATSAPPPIVTIDLSLVNRTHATQPLAIYRAAPLQDCAAIAAGDLSMLAAATFTPESCVALEPGKGVPIGATVVVNEGGPPADAGGGADCQAVVVRAPGLADMVLTWRAISAKTDDLDAAQIYLEEAGTRLYVAGDDYVAAAPATFTLPASGCAGLP
jgi:hypothetical protein